MDLLDVDFITEALDFYWRDAQYHLGRKDLGDIERKNYEAQSTKAKKYISLAPQLAKENKQLRSDMLNAIRIEAELREANERMKEALEPFAKMWGELTEEKVRQGGIVYEYNNSRITVADLFTAFNVLNPTK